MRTLASGVALLLLAAPADAQNTADSRWDRWNEALAHSRGWAK